MNLKKRYQNRTDSCRYQSRDYLRCTIRRDDGASRRPREAKHLEVQPIQSAQLHQLRVTVARVQSACIRFVRRGRTRASELRQHGGPAWQEIVTVSMCLRRIGVRAVAGPSANASEPNACLLTMTVRVQKHCSYRYRRAGKGARAGANRWYR